MKLANRDVTLLRAYDKWKKNHTVRGLLCGPSCRCCCLVMFRFTLPALACLLQSQWSKNTDYYSVHATLAIYRHPGIQPCILRVYPVVGFIRYIMMALWHGDVSALLALCEGSPAFVYQFLWASNKGGIRLLHYCPFVKGIYQSPFLCEENPTGNPIAKDQQRGNVLMSRRHHGIPYKTYHRQDTQYAWLENSGVVDFRSPV